MVLMVEVVVVSADVVGSHIVPVDRKCESLSLLNIIRSDNILHQMFIIVNLLTKIIFVDILIIIKNIEK